jgi:hypothetical protein
MDIKQPNQRYFTFRLEGIEWNPDNGKVARKFLEEFKRAVPVDHREFDSTTNTYTVDGCYFETVFQPLKQKYFKEAQPEMFG